MLPVELSGEFELARRHPIAVAVRLVAQVRAAADDAARRGGPVGSTSGRSPTRVEPVRAPLPHVPRGVEAGRSRSARRRRPARCRGSRRPGCCRGEGPLPDVAAVHAARLELVAPGEPRLLEPSPRRVLPLRLGRQAHVGPVAVRRASSHDTWTTGWSSRPSIEDCGPLGMGPVGPEHLAPPWGLDDAAGRLEVIWEQAAEHERPAFDLGRRAMAGRRDERARTARCSPRRCRSSRAGPHLAHGPLAVAREPVGVVGAHEERAAGQRHQGSRRSRSTPTAGVDP